MITEMQRRPQLLSAAFRTAKKMKERLLGPNNRWRKRNSRNGYKNTLVKARQVLGGMGLTGE